MEPGRLIERRNPLTERRVAGGQVRAGASRGIFTARAVQYGRVDSYGSVWAPGCFDQALDERLPVICFGHDWLEPIGRATSWRSTPEGPEITARLDMHADVPKARQAAAQLASGTLTDVSVGFSNVTRREPTTEERKRWPGVKEVILKASMDELSLVVVGAVPGALVTSSRSAALARAYAEGTITLDQLRAERELEVELDETLDLVAKWASTRRQPAAVDPVDAWVRIATERRERGAAERRAAAERAERERQMEQAAQERRATPWSGLY